MYILISFWFLLYIVSFISKTHSLRQISNVENTSRYSPAARVFYISLVFSNARRVLSQCNTRRRPLYLWNKKSLLYSVWLNWSAMRLVPLKKLAVKMLWSRDVIRALMWTAHEMISANCAIHNLFFLWCRNIF